MCTKNENSRNFCARQDCCKIRMLLPLYFPQIPCFSNASVNDFTVNCSGQPITNSLPFRNVQKFQGLFI